MLGRSRTSMGRSMGRPLRSVSTPISLHTAMFIPKACARLAISWAMLPNPSRPSVRP